MVVGLWRLGLVCVCRRMSKGPSTFVRKLPRMPCLVSLYRAPCMSFEEGGGGGVKLHVVRKNAALPVCVYWRTDEDAKRDFQRFLAVKCRWAATMSNQFNFLLEFCFVGSCDSSSPQIDVTNPCAEDG